MKNTPTTKRMWSISSATPPVRGNRSHLRRGMRLWNEKSVILRLLVFARFRRNELFIFWYQGEGAIIQLVANSLCGSNCSEVPQDNECVTWKAQFACKVHCNKRYQAQSVFQPHKHHTLINLSNPNDRGLHSARNGYRYSFETRTKALTWPVRGITLRIYLSIARCPRLREHHLSTFNHLSPSSIILRVAQNIPGTHTQSPSKVNPGPGSTNCLAYTSVAVPWKKG